jgi:HSP20 family protein
MSEQNELCCHQTAAAQATPAVSRPAVTYQPQYTSRYDQEAWEVAVRLPGVNKENVSVNVENEILEVRASRNFEIPQGWRPLGHYEASRHYRLRLDVGPEVDETRIEGALNDGVLTLRLPLREELKPRSIDIK